MNVKKIFSVNMMEKKSGTLLEYLSTLEGLRAFTHCNMQLLACCYLFYHDEMEEC